MSIIYVGFWIPDDLCGNINNNMLYAAKVRKTPASVTLKNQLGNLKLIFVIPPQQKREPVREPVR
jgi:hypothetical protein